MNNKITKKDNKNISDKVIKDDNKTKERKRKTYESNEKKKKKLQISIFDTNNQSREGNFLFVVVSI